MQHGNWGLNECQKVYVKGFSVSALLCLGEYDWRPDKREVAFNHPRLALKVPDCLVDIAIPFVKPLEASRKQLSSAALGLPSNGEMPSVSNVGQSMRKVFGPTLVRVRDWVWSYGGRSSKAMAMPSPWALG
jgi:hypothetical protein